MNEVIITINPFTRKNSFVINGEPISRYNELINYVHEPLVYWCNQFFNVLDDELNDYYTVQIYSLEFEFEILKELSAAHVLCREISRCVFPLDLSLDERISSLKSKNVLNNESEAEIYSSEIKTSDEVFNFVESERCGISVKNNRIIVSGNEKYQNKILHAYVVSEMMYPALNSFCRNENDFENRINPIVLCESYMEVECDSGSDIYFSYLGNNYDPNDFRYEYDSSVVDIREQKIYGRNEGETTVRVLFPHDYSLAAEIKVTVKKIYKATSIEITADRNIYYDDEQIHLKKLFVPEDADDIDDYILSSSDLSVVSFDDNEKPIIHGAGKTFINLSNGQLTSQVELFIKPTVKEIVLEKDYYEIDTGQKKIIDIRTEPMCDTDFLFSSSNERIAYLVKENDEVSIKANGVGKCILTVEDSRHNCRRQIEVKVNSTLYKHKKHKNRDVNSILSIILTLGVALFFDLDTNQTGMTVMSILSTFGVLSGVSSLIDKRKIDLLAVICLLINLFYFSKVMF